MNRKLLLDDPIALRDLDSQGLVQMMADMPDHCRAASRTEWTLPDDYRAAQQLVLCGMGGSGIGNDLIHALLAPELGLPVLVHKDYGLPAFAGPDTLVALVSYSGQTEEVLSAYADARAAGAKVAAISAGGLLKERVSTDGLPHATLPEGLQPRAAIGYLFFCLLRLVEELGWLDGGLEGAAATHLADGCASHLERLRSRYDPRIALDQNPAKQIAEELHGRLPVIYGSTQFAAPAALRWKCQINENAKSVAFWNALPEMGHNEIEGWEHPEALRGRAALVFLRDRADHPQIALRIGATKDLLEEALCRVIEVESEGDTKTERLFSLIFLGDWVSVYLAYLQGVDPSVVKRIGRLKERLAQ